MSLDANKLEVPIGPEFAEKPISLRSQRNLHYMGSGLTPIGWLAILHWAVSCFFQSEQTNERWKNPGERVGLAANDARNAREGRSVRSRYPVDHHIFPYYHCPHT